MKWHTLFSFFFPKNDAPKVPLPSQGRGWGWGWLDSVKRSHFQQFDTPPPSPPRKRWRGVATHGHRLKGAFQLVHQFCVKSAHLYLAKQAISRQFYILLQFFLQRKTNSLSRLTNYSQLLSKFVTKIVSPNYENLQHDKKISYDDAGCLHRHRHGGTSHKTGNPTR